jgi:branched-chain amino acid transport system ATP-binding protein
MARVRHWLATATGGAPWFPLVVLFGLNAVDELDRTAFAVLLPEIRDEFGLDLQGVLTVVGLVFLAALALQVPIAVLADRSNRVRIAWIGACAWAVFSVMTGLVGSLLLLGIARGGSGIGRAVVDPTHNSLLADYYDIPYRARVFSIHRMANAVGAFIGPIAAGLLAAAYGWRAPFLILALPTFVFVVMAWRLREPVRGGHERRAMGVDEEAVGTEEPAPSFAEAWRIVWKIETLRRIWVSLPFLAAALIGFALLAGIHYEQTFDLDEKQRGFVLALAEPAQLFGLIYGARIATRLMAKGPAHVLGFLSQASVVVALACVVFALAPTVAIAVVANIVINGSLSVLLPGILATLALAIPPRARSVGFSVASLWVIPGLLILPVVGWLGDRTNLRVGMLAMMPVFLIGGVLIARTKATIASDINEVWQATAARAQDAAARRAGRAPLLTVKNLDVAYGSVQVLFNIDLDVEEGECVALLGTNGAGKSTLLKAIAGVVEADHGVVILDGREITHAPPEEIAAHGISQVPGGAGVFPTLTVAENLEMASWLVKGDKAEARRRIDKACEIFPVLARRADDPAGDLSGGQQQMLALGMALAGQPKLLMIDELSLGLAPTVVAQLLPLVEEAVANGTTVVLVEQSVQVALQVAHTAVFLEKGEVRFRGPTAELLERPDVLRSVFLEGASVGLSANGSTPTGAPVSANGSTPEAASEPPGANGSRPATPQPAVAAAPTTGPGADAPPPVLETVDLAVAFGGIRAVDHVSIQVAPGEVLGIVGANGAGKTTLFDLICGYLSPDHGRVLLSGRDITKDGPAGRAAHGLGRSFQDARLFPSLTVEEVIAVACERFVSAPDPISAALHLPNAYDSERKVSARVAELIELLGLDRYRSAFVRELSTGTRRIVDLACLLAHRPSVILLDEPSSGIAQREAEALAPMLRQIGEGTGASLVVIEHDMPVLRAVADRLVAMDQGAVIADGPVADVLRDPAVVAAYLGTTEAAIERSVVPGSPRPKSADQTSDVTDQGAAIP